MSTNAPVRMPATAPLKLNLRQKRLSMIVGPKAAPKTPQALETRAMIEPVLGFEAMSSATAATPRTTSRPAQSISRSLTLFLRITGLYTSLAKAEAAERSWLSAVLIEAARTAESSTPEISPGKILRTIEIKTSELLLMASS